MKYRIVVELDSETEADYIQKWDNMKLAANTVHDTFKLMMDLANKKENSDDRN